MKATLYFNSISDSNKAANILVTLKSNGHTFQYYYDGPNIRLEGWEGELSVEIVNSISTLTKPAKVEFDAETIGKMLIDSIGERAIATLNCANNPAEAAHYFREWLLMEAYAIEDSRMFEEQEKGE